MSSKPQQKPFKIGSSPPELFYNKEILKILVKFVGEHLCQILLFHKVTGSEAVTWRCSLKKVFLKTQQKSQKNICAGDLSCKPQACNLFKKETLAQVFSCKFWEIFKSTFFIDHLPWLLLQTGAFVCVALSILLNILCYFQIPMHLLSKEKRYCIFEDVLDQVKFSKLLVKSFN